jgi:hypothetical protein
VSERTRGEINAINVTDWVQRELGRFWFKGLFAVDADFATPGDGGSLVMTDQRMAVGIVFGGTTDRVCAYSLAPFLIENGYELVMGD